MEASAKKVQSLEVTLSDRILQIELRTDKIEQKMENFCPLSYDIGERKIRTEEVDKREHDSEETGEIASLDPEQASSEHGRFTAKVQKLQSLEMTPSDNIHQIELKSFDNSATTARLKDATKEGATCKEVDEVVSMDPDRVPSRQEKVMRQIKEKAKNFISSLSIHGVSRIFKTDNPVVRLVWIVLILVSMSFGFNNITRSVSDFNKFDVITNIERINLEKATFTAVTICTENYFSKEYFYWNGTNTGNRETVYDLDLRKFIKYYGSPNFDLDRNNLEYFPSVIDTFTPFFSFTPFLCLRFNGITNRSLETINSNSKYLKFYIENYREDVSGNEYAEYSIHSSFYAYITDNYLNSFFTSDLPPLKINKEYTFRIEKTDMEYKLPRPYNNCTDAYPVTGEKHYRQGNCIEICVGRKIMTKHNCSVSSYYKIKGSRCSRIYEKYKYRKEFTQKCGKECPRQCETTKFNIKHSEQDWPLNYTSFKFTFSDFSFYNITQIPKMNAHSLISSIGGSLGLFIGARFLSLVELLEFIIEVFFVIFTHR